jgi:hypothetical protein
MSAGANLPIAGKGGAFPLVAWRVDTEVAPALSKQTQAVYSSLLRFLMCSCH